MTDRKWARRLTGGEMELVLGKIADAARTTDALVDAIVVVFDIALRDEGSSWAKATSIKPWEYAIPEDQWQTICKALVDRYEKDQLGGSLGAANVAMDWMNKGPSSYDESAVRNLLTPEVADRQDESAEPKNPKEAGDDSKSRIP